jgi:hypothetical protein
VGWCPTERSTGKPALAFTSGWQSTEQHCRQSAGAPVAVGRAHLHTDGLLLAQCIAGEQPVDGITNRLIETLVITVELRMWFAAPIDQAVAASGGCQTAVRAVNRLDNRHAGSHQP